MLTAVASNTSERPLGKSKTTLSTRELRMLAKQSEPVPDYPRPRTRGDCERGVRPCPYVGCRYNLYLEVNKYGSLTLNFPDLEPDEMKASCALDVAETGPHTLIELRPVMNLTRERVRQIQMKIFKKLARPMKYLL